MAPPISTAAMRAEVTVGDEAAGDRQQVHGHRVVAVDACRFDRRQPEAARRHRRDDEQRQQRAHAVVGEALPQLGEEQRREAARLPANDRVPRRPGAAGRVLPSFCLPRCICSWFSDSPAKGRSAPSNFTARQLFGAQAGWSTACLVDRADGRGVSWDFSDRLGSQALRKTLRKELCRMKSKSVPAGAGAFVARLPCLGSVARDWLHNPSPNATARPLPNAATLAVPFVNYGTRAQVRIIRPDGRLRARTRITGCAVTATGAGPPVKGSARRR